MIEIPPELIASQQTYAGDAGREFIAALPARVEALLHRRDLRVDEPSMCGACALVLPVLRADGSPAALKLQALDDETRGEPIALRSWDGAGAVRLLEYDEATGSLLLERLDTRTLAALPDRREAVIIIARLLARLTAVPGPPSIRRLSDVATAMLGDASRGLPFIGDSSERAVLADCIAALREASCERPPCGDRLLHWDLHFENVLAGEREPWLALDPKPLAGDPGVELFPAIDNLFDASEVLWRFDAMTEVLGLPRERARAWTLARVVLQDALWDLEAGRALARDHLEIAKRLLGR